MIHFRLFIWPLVQFMPACGTETRLARFMDMSRKFLSACTIVLTLAVAISSAQGRERSPIVYNRQGNEVGVIQQIQPNGDALMQPTRMALDLGYYDVVVPAAMLKPRARGGWETLLNNEEMAFLPPVPYKFFMPSGI